MSSQRTRAVLRPIPTSMLVLTGAALLLALALPSHRPGPMMGVCAFGALVLAGALVLTGADVRLPDRSTAWRAARRLTFQLTPVVLLMVLYPLAARRIHAEIAGTDLTAVMLAASAAVPWLSQPACTPLYRAVGHLLPLRPDADEAAVRSRLVGAMPMALVLTAPLVAATAIPLACVLHWSLAACLAVVGLVLLHLVFAQAAVLGNITRRQGPWALSWVVYAVALVAAPTWCFMPPVLAAAVHLWPMRRELGAALRAPRYALPDRATILDVGRGLVSGSVLWADKFVLLVVTAATFRVDIVYLAMLPAVLAYNAYFVTVAPVFDQRVAGVRHALEQESFATLNRAQDALGRTMAAGLTSTGLVGGLLTIAIDVPLVHADPSSAPLVVAVSVTSWFFAAVTLLGYKLDYVGHTGTTVALGGTHLVGVLAALTLLPTVPAYTTILCIDALVTVIAVVLVRATWSSPSYTLFWRHATAW